MAGDKKSQGNGMKIAILVGIVVIAILLVVIIVLLLGKDKKSTDEAKENVEKRNVVVTSDNAEDILKGMELAEYIEPGYYNASMTNVWHFAKADAVSEDAYVENVPENTNDVFFDVFLSGDETTPIYQSPVIPRGAELENIALDKQLDAGTYDCVLIYHLIDEEQNTISTLRIGITIIIEN